jgi:hypothetical protein
MFRRLYPLFALVPWADAAPPVEFNREIRPILNAHCFKCHGGVKEAGDLNLQFREQALKAGETGEIAIAPGQPEASAVIDRITTHDVTDRMPKKEPPLQPAQINLLKRWIAEGAKWQNHWAYEAPKSAGRGVDNLVAERLAKEGLAFSPEADIRTLARRLSLDLTGLPPEPERVDGLEAAASADKDRALAEYVEELLASPAYGERWAVPWLDLARYADSKGYESDRFRDMWRYRDWVVDALNADMPYDQFLTEQLGGDLLPEPTEEQIIATAFHRNTPQNDEGGTDNEEFRTYAVLDRLNTTFEALQGTSIGCVQCHGHPYDPFVHREYYELMAFFNNTADADRDDQEPKRKVRARADLGRAAELEKAVAATRAQLATLEQSRADAFDKWLRELKPVSTPVPISDATVSATAGKYVVRPSGRIRLAGDAPERTTITVTAKLPAGPLNALVLEMVPDVTLPGGGSGGASGIGNFILTRISATLDGQPLAIERATATFEQGPWIIADALGLGAKAEGESGWAIAGGTTKPQTATFFLAEQSRVSSGGELRVVLECENERWPQHVLGSFKLRGEAGDVAPDAFTKLPKKLQALIARERSGWTKPEADEITRHFILSIDPAAPALYTQLDTQSAALNALPVAELPIMAELTGKDRRTTKIFHRGNWLDKADSVEPATPQILNAWRDEYPRDRLGFARWLTNGENPLTARVQVNRVWEQLFGVGLVETLEDFGSQGDIPIYQDVLDELAVRFQGEMKWSQKALIRAIVSTRVYRQTSKVSKALLERDPANRLLARGARFRLSSEQIRDQALALAGVLSRKMAGPSVMPYQPPGTWLVPYEGRDWTKSPGEDSRRRALYTFIRRSATYPSMVTFDAPNREFCVVRRIRTNTPLQALDGLNSPVFMEAADGLAKRMTGATLDEQLSRGIAIATLRPARDYEIAVLKKLYSDVGGDLRLVANTILNLDEVLTRN